MVLLECIEACTVRPHLRFSVHLQSLHGDLPMRGTSLGRSQFAGQPVEHSKVHLLGVERSLSRNGAKSALAGL